jgi:integrase
MFGDGRIFPRGKVWWMAIMIDGKEHRESLRTTDEKEALRRYKDRRDTKTAADRDLDDFVTPKQRKILVSELCELRKNEPTFNASQPAIALLKRLEQDFGSFKAMSISRDQLNRYANAKLAEGYSECTVNRTMSELRACFKVGVEHKVVPGKILQIKFKLLDESGHVRQGFYTELELQAIIEALPEHLQHVTLWASITGQRLGEILSLRWSMVADSGNELHIPATICKNGYKRELPLLPKLREILEARAALRINRFDRDELIFHRPGSALPIPEFMKKY